ncbi:MAG: phage tail protein [Bacteroidetes bacterium]|jgi:phage tail-like protein|nr:phage tail protein [Bacteroidota bacterium]
MRPLTTFNFEVDIRLPADGTADPNATGPALCKAAFAECDGLELTMQSKTLTEGGNNVAQIQLVGPVSYGQLTLKRGMTTTFDLWAWFSRVTRPDGYRLRADVTVRVYPTRSAAEEPAITFQLRRCLPVKMRAPALNAKDGGIAIEEMHIAYERLDVKELAGTVSDQSAPAA